MGAGCFSEILPTGPASTLAFACSAIDPQTTPRLRIVSYVDHDRHPHAEAATSVLEQRLAFLSGRDPAAITRAERDAPSEPDGGWDEARLEAWVRDEPFLGRDQVTLRILWLDDLDGNRTGLVPAPGAVALSGAAIAAAARRVDASPLQVTAAVLLHHVGHALGATNRGIPVQDPALQERESPAGHDADPASVLNAGWEDARTVRWVANATYDRYPDAALADWQAARAPGGVCEVRR